MSKLSDEEMRRVRALAQARRDQDRQGWSELERTLWDRLAEAEALIVQAQDALGIDHPVWWLLDDYDGSMDSVKRMKQFIKTVWELLGVAARKGTSDPQWHADLADLWTWWHGKGGYITEGVSHDGTVDAPPVSQ